MHISFRVVAQTTISNELVPWNVFKFCLGFLTPAVCTYGLILGTSPFDEITYPVSIKM